MWWHTLVTQHSRGASRRILNARAYHEFAASLGYIVSSEGCGGVVGNSPVHVLCYCARTLKTGKDIYLAHYSRGWKVKVRRPYIISIRVIRGRQEKGNGKERADLRLKPLCSALIHTWGWRPQDLRTSERFSFLCCWGNILKG